MTVGVGETGADELAARLTRARDGITDLGPANRDVAQLVDARATRDVPRASGALAGSSSITVTADGWGITYGKPYAVPVHWGTRIMKARPWLIGAARATEESWMDTYEQYVQQLLD